MGASCTVVMAGEMYKTRTCYVVLHFLTALFLFITAGIWIGAEWRYGLIEPTEKLYTDKNSIMMDYFKFAQNSGYREYGVFGKLKISMKQYVDEYEENVKRHDDDDLNRGFYPSWFTNKPLGLVWYKKHAYDGTATKTIDHALVKSGATNPGDAYDFKFSDTQWQSVKDKADQQSFQVYQHFHIDSDPTMLQLRNTKRLVFEFKKSEGTNVSNTYFGVDFVNKFYQMQNKVANASVLERIEKSVEDDKKAEPWKTLDKYYDGKIEVDPDYPTLIFWPGKPLNVSKGASDHGYKLYDGANYMTYYDIYKNSGNKDIWEDGDEQKCFNDKDNLNQWCTSKNMAYIFTSDISPDFTTTEKDKSCLSESSAQCLSNYKLAFDMHTGWDTKYQTCKTKNKAGEMFFVSLKNRFKAGLLYNLFSNTQPANDAWKANINLLRFKVDPATKPTDAEFEKLGKNDEIKFEYNDDGDKTFSGKDLAKIYGNDYNKFVMNNAGDTTGFENFRHDDDYFKVVCVDSIMLTTDKSEEWTNEKWKVADYFMVDNEKVGAPRVFLTWFGVIFGFVVLLLFCMRVWGEYTTQLPDDKDNTYGPLPSFGILNRWTWRGLEILSFLLIASILALVIASMELWSRAFAGAKEEWGLTDEGWQILSGLLVLFVLTLLSTVFITALNLISYYKLPLISRKFFTSASSAAVDENSGGNGGSTMVHYAAVNTV